MVWGRFGKAVISLLFLMGSKRAMSQKKGYLFVNCSV